MGVAILDSMNKIFTVAFLFDMCSLHCPWKLIKYRSLAEQLSIQTNSSSLEHCVSKQGNRNWLNQKSHVNQLTVHIQWRDQ